MKEIPVKLGPLALLLTVITILMTTLSVLVFTTARADRHLAESYADTVKIRYELQKEGETLVSEVIKKGAGALVNDDRFVLQEDGCYRTTIEGREQFTLSIALSESGDIREWIIEKRWTEDKSLGDLWDGKE